MKGEGEGAKLGEWYEEGYVVWQMVRMLTGAIDSVLWESRDADGKGVDLWIQEEDRRIACQCKFRSKGSWTWRELGMPRHNEATAKSLSILNYAGEQLARSHQHHYRLITTSHAPELTHAIDNAKRSPDAQGWWIKHGDSDSHELASAWSIDVSNPVGQMELHSRLQRMEVSQNTGATEDLLREHLGNPQNVEDAMGRISTYAKGRLGEKITCAELRLYLEQQGFSFPAQPGDARIAPKLIAQQERFLRRIETSPERIIPRAFLTARIQDQLTGSTGGRLVLVSGEPGSGKSRVLGDFIADLKATAWPVLCLSMDGPEIVDSTDGHFKISDIRGDAFAVLQRYAAGKTAVIVIDQLDHAWWGSGAGQPRAEAIRNLLEKWRCNPEHIHLVIACRTIDARPSTQLGQWLRNASREPLREVIVEDLPEQEIFKRFASAGMPITAFDPLFRQLLVRPLIFNLALTLHADGRSLTGLSSLSSLVTAYWSWVSTRLRDRNIHEDSERWLDAFAERIVDTGIQRVHPGILPTDPQTQALLLSLGVIRIDDDGYIRPGHQVLIDYRIASMLARDQSRLDKLLTNRVLQDFAGAARIRLAIPLVRDQHFSAISQAIQSSSTRWLLRQAMLRALAQEEHPRKIEITEVIDWLNNPDFTPGIIRDLLEGRTAWIAPLHERGWLDQAWNDGDANRRQTLLHLIGSVARTWSTGTAELLRRWRTTDPSVLDHARLAFSHDIEYDTEELFHERLAMISRHPDTVHLDPSGWISLTERFPKRTAMVALIMAKAATTDQLTGSPFWSHGLDTQTPANLIGIGQRIGTEYLNEYLTWWNSLPEEVVNTSLSKNDDHTCFLGSFSNLFAGIISDAIRSGTTFDSLLAGFTQPLRRCDGWVMLTAGATVHNPSSCTAIAAIAWFTSDFRWAVLHFGIQDTKKKAIALSFLERFIPELPDQEFARWEDWLIHYLEPNSVQRETYRKLEGNYSHPLLTSNMGETPWHLFNNLIKRNPSIGNRLHSRTHSQIGCWDIKFKKLPSLYFNQSELSGLYSPTSPIPFEEAKRWTISQWVAQIRSEKLALNHNNFGQRPHTPETFGQLLHSIAIKDLQRFIPLAQQLNLSDYASIRKHLLWAFFPPTTSESETELKPEQAATLADIAAWSDPDSLYCLALFAQRNPHYPWSQAFIIRILQSTEPCDPSNSGNSASDIESQSLNRVDCIALEALVAIGHVHEPTREIAEIRAKNFAQDTDLVRVYTGVSSLWRFAKNTQAILAMQSYITDPLVGGSGEIWKLIRRFSQHDFPATKPLLQAMLRHSDTQVSTRAGWLMGLLCWDDADVDDLLTLVIRDSSTSYATCQGLAQALGNILTHPPINDQIRRTTIEFLNQKPVELCAAILSPFYDLAAHPHLIREEKFIATIVATNGGRYHADQLIHGFDRIGDLDPVVEAILTLASELSNPTASLSHMTEYRLDDFAKLLYRLHEKATRENDIDVQAKVLDTLDDLIARGTPRVRDWIETISAGN